MEDFLVCIFMKLSLDELILSVPLVCKSWREASLDPLCWRVLDFQELDIMSWHRFAKRVAAQYPLSRLSFSAFLKFAVRRSRGLAVELRFPMFLRASMEDLVFVSNECPRLKILVLGSMSLEDRDHISELAGKWTELEHLEMAANPSTFPELASEINLHCRNFSGLKMAGLRMKDAMAIVNHLPNLKYLNLSNSYISKGTLLLMMNGCKEIEVLTVKHCIGFEADGEVREAAAHIGVFNHEGSKLTNDSDSDSDDCVASCRFFHDREDYRMGRRCLL
ncbi:F-box/LRR-repeat protein-like [Iris pallida]|uniref:F-box/LRR-repeat protein-like n=1 Tax=Iris pallida TaxID=29817 RepID=A0AAX6E1H2_IRIPA|nr:F-box/LRR-repeat protein-like [Iris pallida]